MANHLAASSQPDIQVTDMPTACWLRGYLFQCCVKVNNDVTTLQHDGNSCILESNMSSVQEGEPVRYRNCIADAQVNSVGCLIVGCLCLFAHAVCTNSI